MKYINHFNQDSDQYRYYRPSYPSALFNDLLQKVPHIDYAWDCATGNGQAALSLANYFKKVYATDINQSQLHNATAHPNISYLCCSCENTPILDQTIDLITVAQALHWFNFDSFYREVRRVSKPDAMIAAWCYSLGYFKNKAIDTQLRHLYYDLLAPYWPPERKYIDKGYSDIPFPFVKHDIPPLLMKKRINLEQFFGYLSTWSAIKEYQCRMDINPLDLIFNACQMAWGEPTKLRTFYWPIHMLFGKVF